MHKPTARVDPDSSHDRPANPARRKLLQTGAAGLTAAIAAGSSLVARDQQAVPPTPAAPQGPPPLIPATPPAATGIIDPAALTAETWCEAWVWRPEDWPGQPLDLNVVERNEPTKAPSPGQVFPGQFSFAGISPAPTIRVRSGGTLRVRLRNMLGANFGKMWVGPCPDPPSMTPAQLLEFEQRVAKAAGKPIPTASDPAFNVFQDLEALGKFLGVKFMDGHCMPHVSNSEHGSRVTNIHTHGLHVTPGVNRGRGTESDNVQVRLMSKDDWAMRKKIGGAECGTLVPHEYVGHVDYEFILGNVQRAEMQRAGRPPQNDPPGTFWYHPHAHGSTHDQVSAGMAGFLIVEGDVDDAINVAMTGEAHPDPAEPTGTYDYRERLVFVQRVLIPSVDFNAPGSGRGRQRSQPSNVPDEGIPQPTVMFMRPGAVERWRVLNGSVDGRGFKRFMVLNGQFVFKENAIWRVEKVGGDPPARKLVLATRADLEAAKLPLYQLAFDGLTLVTVENGRARHTIKDLSRRNAGTVNPLNRAPAAGENVEEALLRNWEACFHDGVSLRNAFVRPNEVWMATANRADVFFKAPLDAAGKIFTVLAQEETLHTDNFQGRQQRRLLGRQGFGGTTGNPPPSDVVVGYVHVRGAAIDGDFDVMSLRDTLPSVPPFLQPISDDETRMTVAEARVRNAPAGSHRTRTVSYTGYGAAGFPLIEVPESFAKAHPELRNLRWAEHDGTRVLLAPNARTMAINNRFDLAKNPNPPPPQKFTPNDPNRIRPLVNTAEEWVLYNPTPTLWGHTDLTRFPQKGQMLAQFRSYPINRREGRERFWRDHEFRTLVHGADHPFHIHVNPMWVTRIEVPDEEGRLHNLLEEPRWMDTVSIPRNGGRVVFRSRFADYTGKWIHHCHILMHEDMGMMQEVECVATAAAANPNPKPAVAGHAMTEEQVNAIYPRPSVELSYRQSMSFEDPNPGTGQTFPGFELEVPVLKD
jgi:FtsP/CotA-like multicopper oxidase with cupredoxin domain